MSRKRTPSDGAFDRPSNRRTFLAQLLVPAAAAAASTPLVAAFAEAAESKPARKTAAKPKPAPAAAADPFASARPDVSVAKTPEERATLEKQWKSMVEILGAIRKAELPEDAAPAVAFAALARDETARRKT
jgi:hypothetical protein